ncbi:MAG: outer membrane beta-barrel protein [Candidatus Zixiibacteriota bacterium]
MKKSIMIFGLVTCFAAAAFAQTPPSPFSIYAGGLMSMPNSPDGFKDSYKNGFHGFVGLGFKMVPAVQFVGKVEYHSFKFDWDQYTVPTASGGTQGIWMYGADARFAVGAPGAPVKPFALIGGGLAHVTHADFSDPVLFPTPENESKFYYNIGGGIQMHFLPAVDLFAQVRYVSIATEGEKTTMVPISVGVKIF